tara:strand:- start:618 stop:920 length:303 start_codon:yes stop_codon:yes gene_type:complete
MADDKQDKLPIRCPQELANGVYANLGIVNYNQDEFVLDFIYLHPNTKSGDIRSRVILHPNHVRRLVNTLTNQLENYDKKHSKGDNNDDDDGLPPITLNFN